MLHRLAISIDERELQQIKSLQKRFHIQNRSAFFRELVRRYEKIECDYAALQQCLAGYLDKPESADETRAILRMTLKRQPHENWQ